MIKRLLQINGLATFSVVLFHASGWGFVAMFWWTHRYQSVTVPNFDQLGNPSYYGLRLVEQLTTFGIPAFLFVSGYFIAFATGRSRTTIDWKTVGSRIWYLLIPYVLWSLLIFLTEVLQGDAYTLRQYGYRLLTGKATAAFYYVPMICQLYLLSPFIIRLARYRWWLLLIIATFVQLFVGLLGYLQILGKGSAILEPLTFFAQSWLFTNGIFWFSVGIVVGFNLKQFRTSLNRARWFLLTSVIVLLFAGIIEWEILLRSAKSEWLAPRMTLLDSLYAAAFIFTLLAFFNARLPFESQLGKLGPKSYGVYLSHTLVLEFTARSIYFIVPAIMAYQLIFQGILVAAGLGIPLLLMSLANRQWFPPRRYYRYVFG